MCLYKVDKEARPCTVGYKVMRQCEHDPALTGIYRSQWRSRPMGRWLDEADFSDIEHEMLRTDTGDYYPRGWHVFHKKSDALADARSWASDLHRTVAVKVIVRKPLAVGTQICFDGRITVAKEIKIVEVISNVQ